LWCEYWEEYEAEALSFGISQEDYWNLTPRQVGDLIIHKRNKELELAYYTSVVTGAAVWGKAPKKPLTVGEPKKEEQSLEEMAFNIKLLKATHNK
jgi:hypothetical protein